MSVAPSFQKLKTVGEPFEEGGKEYIYVEYPDGHQRKVRWYEETLKKIRPTKEVLGFSKGYINLIKGNVEDFAEWLAASPATYHTYWGWSFRSDIDLPTLPEGLSLAQLPWDQVANVEKDELKPKSVVENIVAEVLYGPSTSTWQGSVGERIDRKLKVTRVIPLENGFYGPSTFFLFVDKVGNEYCWTTGAKQLEVGVTYAVRGTIKELKTYKGKQQTVLTRCKII